MARRERSTTRPQWRQVHDPVLTRAPAALLHTRPHQVAPNAKFVDLGADSLDTVSASGQAHAMPA